MDIKHIIYKLKEHLENNLDFSWYGEGDTEMGFTPTMDFDMYDLWNEIDAFCESFKQREEAE